MINPDIPRPKDGDPITVRFPSVPNMRWARPYISIPGRHTIKNMNIVNNHIADVLERNAPTAGDVHVGATAVDGLEAIDYELVFELDLHIG